MPHPVVRYARVGLWALPIFAATLLAGTITHQPPPQTDLAGWSAYVTTNASGKASFTASGLAAIPVTANYLTATAMNVSGVYPTAIGHIFLNNATKG